MIRRVLICGDRDWIDFYSIKSVICTLIGQYGDELAVIHGAARGADHMAGQAGLDEQLTTWVEPAKWTKHGNRAGPIRNSLMLNRYKPELVIAFHSNITESKGTKHMVSIARNAGVPVIVIANRAEAENILHELPETKSLCSEVTDSGTENRRD